MAGSRWSTIIQGETHSFPTHVKRSRNAKAKEAGRTIRERKEWGRGRQENGNIERTGQMLAAEPGVWSFVWCTLTWFEGPLLVQPASLYDLKESFCISMTV